MSNPRTERTGLPPEVDVAPDMLAELGPLAYALLALGETGPLSEVQTLDESRAARLPAQSTPSSEREIRSEALLDELGNLDF